MLASGFRLQPGLLHPVPNNVRDIGEGNAQHCQPTVIISVRGVISHEVCFLFLSGGNDLCCWLICEEERFLRMLFAGLAATYSSVP